MKRTVILLLAVMSSASMAWGQTEKQKVAIYTTDNSGQNIVEFVGDFLINAIVKRGYVTVERTDRFLAELNEKQSFQRTGTVDDNQISRLGKDMGVQLVCVVKIGKSGDQLFISARLVDVETAALKAAARPVRFTTDDWDGIEKSCEAITASIFGERGAHSVSSGSSRASSSGDNRHPAEPEMVFVQGGTFWMGCSQEQQGSCEDDESPLHSVTVSDFHIGKYEITQAQWKLIMGNNPSEFKGDNLPVETVSWDDVQVFITRLNAATGKRYRLPTEAEWEYAARGGNQSAGYTYSGSHNLHNVGWFTDNSGGKPHVVGTKLPNELGIYDMSGNVLEWCIDWFGSYPASTQHDPMGVGSGSYRVIRGGGWYFYAQNCRVANRDDYSPDARARFLGFRVVLP
jgi:formylglycine-generating enzyme required for sulfatase activity